MGTLRPVKYTYKYINIHIRRIKTFMEDADVCDHCAKIIPPDLDWMCSCDFCDRVLCETCQDEN